MNDEVMMETLRLVQFVRDAMGVKKIQRMLEAMDRPQIPVKSLEEWMALDIPNSEDKAV